MTAPRIPPRISPSYLENAALHYLERFAASSALLRRVLARKVARSASHWGDDPEQARTWIDAVVAKMVRLGYIDDGAYAAMKVRSLHGRGKGERVIRAALAARGINRAAADQALAQLVDDLGGNPDPDQAAARALARKRRLGPYRPADQRAAHRQRDLAILARAGFDFDTARAVIDAEDDTGNGG